ncbi:hypothetical protein FRB90_009641 [Tulasnella sp. 427]|nr:hypothetical protein FRB90_009641 [Tulasnella sp. 427]
MNKNRYSKRLISAIPSSDTLLPQIQPENQQEHDGANDGIVIEGNYVDGGGTPMDEVGVTSRLDSKSFDVNGIGNGQVLACGQSGPAIGGKEEEGWKRPAKSHAPSAAVPLMTLCPRADVHLLTANNLAALHDVDKVDIPQARSLDGSSLASCDLVDAEETGSLEEDSDAGRGQQACSSFRNFSPAPSIPDSSSCISHHPKLSKSGSSGKSVLPQHSIPRILSTAATSLPLSPSPAQRALKGRRGRPRTRNHPGGQPLGPPSEKAKTFKCECHGRLYRRINDLRRHLNEGRYPEVCDGCGEGFRRKDPRIRHWDKNMLCEAIHHVRNIHDPKETTRYTKRWTSTARKKTVDSMERLVEEQMQTVLSGNALITQPESHSRPTAHVRPKAHERWKASRARHDTTDDESSSNPESEEDYEASK